jgi:hypothetical protein
MFKSKKEFNQIVNNKIYPINKREHLLIIARVYHFIVMMAIPFTIICLTILIPNTGYLPHTEKGLSPGFGIFMLYLISTVALLFGYKWGKFYEWLEKHIPLIIIGSYLDDNYWKIFNSHLIRVNNFGIIIICVFILGLMGVNWYILSPLLLSAGIALVLTYPTKVKWEKWTTQNDKDQIIVNSNHTENHLV